MIWIPHLTDNGRGPGARREEEEQEQQQEEEEKGRGGQQQQQMMMDDAMMGIPEMMGAVRASDYWELTVVIGDRG